MDAYDVESKAIEEVAAAWVDEDFLREVGFEGDVRACQAMVSNYLRRNWFRKNGVMPDLIEMMDDTDKRQEFVKAMGDDTVNVSTFLMQALKRSKTRLETVKRNIDIPDEEESGGFGGEGGEGGFDESGADDGFDAEGGEGGLDDFDDAPAGDDFDMGGDDVDADTGGDVEADDDLDADTDTAEDTDGEAPESEEDIDLNSL